MQYDVLPPEEYNTKKAFKPMNFSLTELSVLIRILRYISIDDMYNFPDLHNLIKHYKEAVLHEIGGVELFKKFEKTFVKREFGFDKKLEEIIFYYTSIIDIFMEEVVQSRINQQYKNVFVVWHIFGFARMLIRQFFVFHKDDPLYNFELAKQAHEDQTNR
uniref:NR LBD domain-containing protein n=1 Tax=Meloidogyne hapla TaxID=6305 RepID=A0A1I8BW11_MELHA